MHLETVVRRGTLQRLRLPSERAEIEDLSWMTALCSTREVVGDAVFYLYSAVVLRCLFRKLNIDEARNFRVSCSAEEA